MILSLPVRSLLLVALSIGASDAFAPSIRSTRSSTIATFMSEPSDTGSDPFYDNDEDGVVTVESEDFIPTDNEAMVTNVLDLMPSALGEVSESDRAKINEVLLKLESLNPTENPATSPLLNGVWELRYAAGYTSEGAFPSPTR